MDFFRQMLVIARKDLRAELRTKEAINASLAFALVILVLFSFAFDPLEEQTREMSGGAPPQETAPGHLVIIHVRIIALNRTTSV